MGKHTLIFTFVYMVIFYVWLYVFQENVLMRIVGDNIFSIIGAGISFVWVFRAFQRISEKQRYFWLLLGIGTLCFIIAQSIWFYNQMIYNGTAPFPSWADFFWLMQYSLYLIALIYKLMLNRGVSRIHSIFNIIIFMAIAITLSIHFLIKPIFESEINSVLALVTSIAYPTLDLGFLFATVGLYYNSQYGVRKKIIFLITIGFVIQIIADSLHIYLLSINQYLPGSLIDPLWVVTLLIIGLAGIYAQHNYIKSQTEHEVNSSVEPGYDLLPYASVIVLLALVILNARNQSVNSLEIGLFVVMLLIIIRQVFIMVDNRNLLKELKCKNDELGKSEERYRHLVEISPSAISVEIEGKIIYVNKAGLELFGATAIEDIIGKSVRDIVHKDYYETIQLRHQKASIEKHAVEAFEFPIMQLDGGMIYIESSLAEINYNGVKAYLSIAQDVTHRKHIEEKIKFMAYYDELTKLPNRAMFHEQLIEQIEIAKNNNGLVAVMFVDLDRFKFINDSLGHGFGDFFLKQVSQRLSKIIDLNGTVYRHGGDEFCVIIDDASQDKASLVAQQMIDGLSKPFIIENSEFFTSPSIGISLYPIDGEDQDALIRHADIAMYSAKKQGGNNYRFYISALDEENFHKMDVENALRKAIETREFLIHYQPKVNLNTGEIIGLEALVRWQHPERGLIPPIEFISIAEETGLIVAIGRWVLQEACKQMKKWHDEGFSTLGIAVNISPRQFNDKNLIENVAQVLEESGLNPRYLEIEITETVMQNIQESSVILHELKKLGVQISIDDFGTGYSSLNYLKHLPIDNLKVDKSFVDDININPKDEAIIKTILDMGHHLKINVIAEGIENEQQLHSLMEHQCNVGQGYFFSKPLPPAQVELIFKQNYGKS